MKIYESIWVFFFHLILFVLNPNNISTFYFYFYLKEHITRLNSSLFIIIKINRYTHNVQFNFHSPYLLHFLFCTWSINVWPFYPHTHIHTQTISTTKLNICIIRLQLIGAWMIFVLSIPICVRMMRMLRSCMIKAILYSTRRYLNRKKIRPEKRETYKNTQISIKL